MLVYCAGSSEAAGSVAAAGSSLTSDAAAGSAEAVGSASEEVHRVCYTVRLVFDIRHWP